MSISTFENHFTLAYVRDGKPIIIFVANDQYKIIRLNFGVMHHGNFTLRTFKPFQSGN